jgi:hypothetical protein
LCNGGDLKNVFSTDSSSGIRTISITANTDGNTAAFRAADRIRFRFSEVVWPMTVSPLPVTSSL